MVLKREKPVLLNAIAHHPQTSPPDPDQLPFVGNSPWVYIQIMTFYAVECPFGQFPLGDLSQRCSLPVFILYLLNGRAWDKKKFLELG